MYSWIRNTCVENISIIASNGDFISEFQLYINQTVSVTDYETKDSSRYV